MALAAPGARGARGTGNAREGTDLGRMPPVRGGGARPARLPPPPPRPPPAPRPSRGQPLAARRRSRVAGHVRPRAPTLLHRRRPAARTGTLRRRGGVSNYDHGLTDARL